MPDWSRLTRATPSVSERLAGGLEAMIRTGELEVGSRIPPERVLAQTLGVSRASLREALHELELRGLVERRPGRGTTVGDPDGAALADPLLRIMSGEERTIAEVMDLRAAVEPPVAARAARRATDADVLGLRAILAEMGPAAAERFVELDVALHVAIARAAHNRLLARLMETAGVWVKPSREASVQSAARRAASVDAHAVIVDAIAAHDPDAAAAAMRDHIATISRMVGGPDELV
jgi:GntR family transcriptional repressor for pyruvate dehydrogenase complex